MGKQLVEKYKSFIIYKNYIGTDQLFITVSVEDKGADPVDVCSNIYKKIIEIIDNEKMDIVYERIFGSLSIQDKIIETRCKVLEKISDNCRLPYTYIQGQPVWGEGLAGIHIRSIKVSHKENIWTIYDDKVACGRGWIKDNTRFIVLQNIHTNGNVGRQSREEQTDNMFDRAQGILEEEGADYKNVVRTWIYLSNILGWYNEFNSVRNKKYRKFNIIPESYSKENINKLYLPASTGIQGENNIGAAAIMDIYVVIPEKNSGIEIESTSGAVQNAAFHYGSAFSRAISIYEPDNTQILVSGTASIDDRGKSVFQDDAKSQMVQTFDVISALIKEKGAKLKDIYDSTIYLKRPEDINELQTTLKEYGLKEMPAICVLADICRDELLFEVDAVVVLNSRII